MNAHQWYLVRNSLEWFTPCGPAFVARVLQRVREKHASAADVLGPCDERAHQRLFATLRQAVRAGDAFARLEPALLKAGAAAGAKGATPDLYTVIRDELIDTMRELADDDWSDALTHAWRDALDSMAGVLVRGALAPRRAA